jgi:hypothetical protein
VVGAVVETLKNNTASYVPSLITEVTDDRLDVC